MAERSNFRIPERLLLPAAERIRALGNSVLGLLLPEQSTDIAAPAHNEIRRIQ